MLRKNHTFPITNESYVQKSHTKEEREKVWHEVRRLYEAHGDMPLRELGLAASQRVNVDWYPSAPMICKRAKRAKWRSDKRRQKPDAQDVARRAIQIADSLSGNPEFNIIDPIGRSAHNGFPVKSSSSAKQQSLSDRPPQPVVVRKDGLHACPHCAGRVILPIPAVPDGVQPVPGPVTAQPCPDDSPEIPDQGGTLPQPGGVRAHTPAPCADTDSANVVNQASLPVLSDPPLLTPDVIPRPGYLELAKSKDEQEVGLRAAIIVRHRDELAGAVENVRATALRMAEVAGNREEWVTAKIAADTAVKNLEGLEKRQAAE